MSYGKLTDYADASPFRGRVAHGMLLGSWISALLGEKLLGEAGVGGRNPASVEVLNGRGAVFVRDRSLQ